MKKNIIYFLSLIVLMACRPDRDPDPVNQIIGYVDGYDEFGNELPNTNRIFATVESSNSSAAADTSGKFVLYNYISAGPLNILFTGDGFNVINYYVSNVGSGSIPFYLNNKDQKFKLCQPSTTVVQTLTFTTNPSLSEIKVSGKLSPAGTPEKPRGYLIFASKSPNVSPENYDKVFGINDKYFYFTNEEGEGLFASESETFTKSLKDLQKYGFKKGSIVYLRAYGSSIFTNAYTDLGSGKLIFPNINFLGSNVISVQVP
ncbi:MAG: hypothetical protein J7604_14660 [Sporocytophaga sp.]|uniref:hypothetical protein n=1 Tax=Sporocytophaga sp. TaxID=2231183 RepID=UPI001B250F75|nr:hypothetical protein [Sporocytophaga sp.]MBO9701448.1 hypothetical protein [Sporocytophaga sp.]